MKIELSTGYVILKDFITHKASRDYQAELLKGTRMEPTGELDEEGRPKMKYDLDPNNADRANEALVIALIEKAVVITDGVETSVTPSIGWLESMRETDFSKIERAALEIKSQKEEEGKKS